MKLINWKPRREMVDLFDDIDKMLNQPFVQSDAIQNNTISYSPFMDVNESDMDFTVSMDLPGVDKKDVEVNLHDGIVTVVGEGIKSTQKKDTQSIWKEASYGAFQRSFELTTSVREDKIKARFKNGVLTLTIPKAEEVKAKVKKIDVN